MQVTCNHCGAKNPIGRIFCMACGQRMTITNADVEKARAQARPSLWPKLLSPLIWGGVIALMVVVLWPSSPFPSTLKESDRPLVLGRVESKINALRSAATGGFDQKERFQPVELEALAWRRNVETNTPQFSVLLADDRLTLRRIDRFGPWTLLGRSWGPLTISRDAVMVADGAQLKVVGGRFGHLPLPGPAHALVSGPVMRGVTWTPRDQAVIAKLRKITIKDGEIEIEVGP